MLPEGRLTHATVHGTAFCNSRLTGRSTALPGGTARLENFRNFYLAHFAEVLSGVRQMFELQSMTPGPIFNQMFADLQVGQFTRQSALDYLTGSRWTRDPRGNDDRSLAIMALVQ